MFEERMAGGSEALEALNRAQVFQGQAVDTSKLGMETGKTASVVANIDSGRVSYRNDGDPTAYVVGNGYTVPRSVRRAAYPNRGGHGVTMNESMDWREEAMYRRAHDRGIATGNAWHNMF